ncbi:MAG: metallophosphoesterase [Armatimonadota bacterium]|nr:metallophosphoesterase [Armatimonadota bacterium]MDR7543378.1 metallophosphoesterase [Armatimonadota bacterium]
MAGLRVLACADIHGRPERIARVRALVAEHHPDVVLLPGDLTHLGRGEEALDLLHVLPVPVLAVPGNMDDARAAETITRRGRLAGAEPVVIGGVSFGGPEVGGPCDLLVTHEPPRGTLDVAFTGQHVGSHTVREILARVRPKAHACGHIHESPGIAEVEGTLVVNCTMGDGKTGGALIEVVEGCVTARLL